MVRVSYKIVIPTIRKYSTALEILQASLRACNIPRDQLILVYANEDRQGLRRDPDGRWHVYLKRNIYEYTAFFGVQELYKQGLLLRDVPCLLLHDTTYAGPNFRTKLDHMMEVHRDYGANLLWMSEQGTFNICIFNDRVVEQVCARLGPYMTMDKMKAIDMEHNRDPDSFKQMSGFTQGFIQVPVENRGLRQVYSNIIRTVVYMPTLDLEKYYVHADHSHPHPQTP